MKQVKYLIAIISLMIAELAIPTLPAKATGFRDLATCFTTKKGDNKPIQELGECKLGFSSSYGGGTAMEMSSEGKFSITGRCPGETINAGLTGCMVNGEPGILKLVGGDTETGTGIAFCMWKHKDKYAYCAFPYNHIGP